MVYLARIHVTWSTIAYTLRGSTSVVARHHSHFLASVALTLHTVFQHSSAECLPRNLAITSLSAGVMGLLVSSRGWDSAGYHAKVSIRDVPIAFAVLKLFPKVYGKFKALGVSGMFQ